MNPETGRIYEGEDEIAAARQRGEPLVELSPSVAGQLAAVAKRDEDFRAFNRRERRALQFNHQTRKEAFRIKGRPGE